MGIKNYVNGGGERGAADGHNVLFWFKHLHFHLKNIIFVGIMAGFRKIDELIRTFDREKRLLVDMFQKRKSLTFRMDDAMALVEHKEQRIRYLIDHGVIRVSGDFLEMEDVYLQFFEDVLQTNEIINVALVKEFIDKLNENITYYLEEKSEQQRYKYIREVTHTLRSIALTTLRNVIDLKRNVDNTYKSESNLKIKKSKLERLDQKRSDIATLIREAEQLIDDKQPVFFAVAMDVGLSETVGDVKWQLSDAYHNLIEIDRQIINYLNMILHQSEMLKKLQQLKYLRDQQILEVHTNIRQVADSRDPVWMEPAARYSTKPSLQWLRTADEARDILRRVMEMKKLPERVRRQEADAIPRDYFTDQAQEQEAIDMEELFRAFAGQGKDLFCFVRDYDFKRSLSTDDRLALFCQLATRYYNELDISEQTAVADDIEYAIIHRN